MLPDEVARRYASVWPAETLSERFASVTRAHADRIAIIDGATRLTFAECARRVERLAGGFLAMGVRAGEIVSWQLPNWWEAAIVHHAILRAGAIPNPLNPAFRERELRHVIAQAKPRVLVVPGEWRGFAHSELARSFDVDVVVARGDGGDEHDLNEMMQAPSEAPPQNNDPAACALVLYTSGTTSEPKGVEHTHRSLLYQASTFQGAHALTPEDRYLGGPPVTHIAGLSYGIIAPFALGTSTAFLDRWEPANALALAVAERTTFMTGPPTFLLTMAEALRSEDLSAFRLFSTGGASIPTETVRAAGTKLGCVVKRAYGSTEVPFLTASSESDDEAARVESDGRALGLNELRIEKGEIWARSPGMFTGYLDVRQNDFTDDGWFRTGDLGVLDERELLHVTGRLKGIIIRGGENISAKELEDLLLLHPAVRDVAVIGIPDARLGERVCAIVVGTLSFDEMTAFLTNRGIAKHKLPERLETRAELPKTDSGKIRKEELRASIG